MAGDMDGDGKMGWDGANLQSSAHFTTAQETNYSKTFQGAIHNCNS